MNIESIGSLYLEPQLPRISAPKPEAPEPTFSRMLDAAAEKETREKKPKIDKTDKLYEQCEALETFLIKNLINGMRNTVEKSGFIDEGFAGKMYEDMLYDEYAKEYTKNSNFGLAELAYLELTGQR
ncbi:MAG: rod-binding protein [Spirochaetaceae bacterium]|jgi:flagellar protein FlgJ|nr:rod-binding protein [Spirochaetaceae bacterium]